MKRLTKILTLAIIGCVSCISFTSCVKNEIPEPIQPIIEESTVQPTVTPVPTLDPDKKAVAITFDDGPHSKYTTMIVDKLKEYSASATFFIVGNRVDEKCASAIKYANENGCEIAIHGFTHTYYYNKCDDATYNNELEQTADVIFQSIGKRPTLMRPIGGAISSQRVEECKYSVVNWSCDSEDWKHKKDPGSAEQINIIVENVMSTVKDRDIILMHEIYENSYQAFCIILQKLYDQGYVVTNVSNLIGIENIKTGTKYFSGRNQTN